MINTRKPKTICVEGVVYKSITKAANHYGISSSRISWRLNHGWSIEEAFGLVGRKKYELNGKKYNSIR